jgi:glycosyltransferase involved in cell wall biosynthesis
MRFTVILNTFNRAHFLPRVLTAWTRLDPEAFTMVIADDGSEDDTRQVIEDFGARVSYRLLHVCHANEGHRRAEILNKAVHLAEDEALLFTDADSLPAADLLDVHARHFTPRRMLVGGYMRLDEAFTEQLDLDGVRRGDYEQQKTAAVQRRLDQQHRKHRFYTFLRKKGRPHVMGLNMVIPRSGFVAVNGYDNEFRGWGRADGDLRERLKKVGVRPFSDWNTAMVFHLHHPEDVTKKKKANVAYAERRDIPTVAEHGFEQVEDAARTSVVYRNDPRDS